jgi:two-component system response regulator DevR
VTIAIAGRRRDRGGWHDGRVTHRLDDAAPDAAPAADGFRLPEVRLAVADDHPAIGLAIDAAVKASRVDPPIRFVGHARTVAAALELARRQDPDAPDVLLCDLQIERGIDGLEVFAAARPSGPRVIAYTSHDRSSLMRAVFEAGGAGFLSKTEDLADVLAAVRTVAAGGSAFTARALDAVRDAPRLPSEREVDVIAAVARGLTSDEIGHRLSISGRTVESHLRRLFDRYAVVARSELVVLATREGWIDLERDRG